MTQRFLSSPVAEIEPCMGWVLHTYPEDDGDGFSTPAYIARGAERDVMLGVSRFRFTPTQDRFDWLVQAGFPRCPKGSWTDMEIDAEKARSPRLAA